MQNTETKTITFNITSVDGEGVAEVLSNVGTSGMFYEVESFSVS